MLLWLIFAVLTALVLFIVLAPLARGDAALKGADGASDSAADLAVYRDQLHELDAEIERGLISPGEAEAAKTEVSRRLLQHAEHGGSGKGEGSETGAGNSRYAASPEVTRAIFYSTMILLPALVLSLYLWVGEPNMPGQPHGSARQSPAQVAKTAETAKAARDFNALITQVEQKLRENPRDGKGWDVLAPVYLKLGRSADAAAAYSRAMDLLGETPDRLAGYAEATVITNKGVVNEPARKAFERLGRLQPGRPDVRFWLAVAIEQDGKLQEAASEYRAMLKTGEPGAPWRHIVQQRLAGVVAKLGGGGAAAPELMAQAPQSNAPVGGPARGPSRADIEAAQQMPSSDRNQMIEAMVARFERKLKAKPDDLPGWKKLMRFYVVLRRKQEALKALADARKQFSGDNKALGELDALAKSFDLGS